MSDDKISIHPAELERILRRYLAPRLIREVLAEIDKTPDPAPLSAEEKAAIVAKVRADAARVKAGRR